MHLRNRLFAICFCVASICSAQELVKDINHFPGSQPPNDVNYSQRCYSCGGKAYAVLIDPTHGSELWVTDGTPDGTHIVKDIAPGFTDGVYNHMPACLNGILYFKAIGLWKTDGTEAGTQAIFSAATAEPIVFKNKIAFTSENMLFTTDGNPANITVVKTFEGAANTRMELSTMTATTDLMYIQQRVEDANTSDMLSAQLWVSDGSTTTKLKEFPEYTLGPAQAAVGNKLLFNSYTASGQTNTWVSDGTVDGTKLLLENAQVSPFPGLNSMVNGKRVLTSSNGRGTWVTDGTSAGTTLIMDDFSAYDVREFKGKIYFLGNDYEDLIEYKIIRTNADYSNRVKLTEPLNGTMLLGVVGEKLLYTGGTSSQGIELLTFDGNQDLPVVLKDINPGTADSYPRSFASTNNVGVFLADDGVHGNELWKSDGTTAGTTLLKDVATNTEDAGINNIYYYNKKMYFIATDNLASPSGASRSLWKSDGTTEGTSIVDPTNHNYYGILFGGAGKYVISDGVFSINKTDTETGVRSELFNTVGVFGGGGTFTPNRKLVVGDNMYLFFAFDPYNAPRTGYELWRINPVTNEVVLTKDIYPGGNGSAYSLGGLDGAAINNKLIFGANNGTETEPWVTDGTPANTMMLKDINPSGSSSPSAFTNAGGKVFFLASNPTDRSQLWITDGTSAGTQVIKGGSSTQATSLGVGALGTNNVVYGASTAGSTTELWISDGTTSGTKNVKTLNASKEGVLSRFTSAGSRTYFVENEKQLWVTDGTDAGTMKIDFENSGTVKPDNRVVSDGVLYFYNDGKIWYTYGSTESTQALGPADPVSDLYITDKYLCFVQNDPTYGNEFFRYALPDPTITGIESLQAERIIQVYPNPTAHTLYVNVTSPSQARIVDASGREYRDQTITNESNSIDVSTLSPGMYFITIKDGRQTRRAKFLKH